MLATMYVSVYVCAGIGFSIYIRVLAWDGIVVFLLAVAMAVVAVAAIGAGVGVGVGAGVRACNYEAPSLEPTNENK